MPPRGSPTRPAGNPLFVEELLRTWVQADVLTREAGAWRFTSSEGPLELPSTVHAIYQSQLDELHAPTRQVATSGSVPGQSFPPGALAAFGVDQAEAGLDELRSLGLLVGPHLGRSGARGLHLPARAAPRRRLREPASGGAGPAARAVRHLDGRPGRSRLADELVGTHLAAAHASLPELTDAVEVDGISWDRERLGVEAADRLERTAERLVGHQPQRAAALLEQSLALDPDAGADVATRRAVLLG